MNHIRTKLVEAMVGVMDCFISYSKCDHRRGPKAALPSRVRDLSPIHSDSRPHENNKSVSYAINVKFSINDKENKLRLSQELLQPVKIPPQSHYSLLYRNIINQCI